jgi:hypothetical protein
VKTKTHFAFRVDVWDGAGDNIHVVGIAMQIPTTLAVRSLRERIPST